MDIAAIMQIAKTKAEVGETNKLLKEQIQLLKEIKRILEFGGH